MVADINNKFLYKDLSYKIIGCFYEVYNELGPAHKEQIYHEALKIAFGEKNIEYKENKRLKIKFRGKDIGVYEPDFVIEDKIIIEIKSVLNMPKVFEKQLYYYLRGTDYKVGYLVNFGNEEIDIRRRVYEIARKSISA
jgi:GxxExxY protein